MKSLTACIAGLLLAATLFGQTGNRNLEISHLTGDFYVFTTYRDFKGTPFPSNGLYLLTNSGVVMVDTPWDTTQFQSLLDSIKIRHDKNVVMCIATHSHEDRTGGLDYYKQKGIITFTTLKTDLICKESNESQAEFLILNDTVFTVGQYSFQTYYGGAGHSPDNIVLWFAKDKILYGGCLVKSVEATDLGYLGDADTKQWPVTINNIKKRFTEPDYVIPGHQDWNDSSSLDHTLRLLQEFHKKPRR